MGVSKHLVGGVMGPQSRHWIASSKHLLKLDNTVQSMETHQRCSQLSKPIGVNSTLYTR